MSIDTALFDALKNLVGNRVAPNVFPQPPTKPTWPAIRYTISSTPVQDICGDDDDDTAQISAQLDVVAETYDAARTLRLSVMSAMRTFSPPATLDNDITVFDEETKTHRIILTYTIHGSS